MSTGILLSYSGIGSNLLHLPYVHEVARKDGPIELITFSEKIPFILKSDPSLKNISYINKYNKKNNTKREINIDGIFSNIIVYK